MITNHQLIVVVLTVEMSLVELVLIFIMLFADFTKFRQRNKSKSLCTTMDLGGNKDTSAISNSVCIINVVSFLL